MTHTTPGDAPSTCSPIGRLGRETHTPATGPVSVDHLVRYEGEGYDPQCPIQTVPTGSSLAVHGPEKSGEGLAPGGAALWDEVTSDHRLDPAQAVQLLEACRAKDRLDKLDALLRGDEGTWAPLLAGLQTQDTEIRIDDALNKARSTADTLKQLLTALRLPDRRTGRRPQRRGTARGAYRPAAQGGAQ